MESQESSERCRLELEGTIALLRIERDRALNDAAKLRKQVAALRQLVLTKFADIEQAMDAALTLPEGGQ